MSVNFVLLKTGAEQGDSVAQFKLGCFMEEGKEVEKDLAQAVKWYEKAANQGHSGAQFMLGCCLDKGKGVKQDVSQAVKWYEKAADQDHPAAEYNFAICLLIGKGVEKNEARALELFQKAAIQDYTPAQYNLGCCLHVGQGIEKNQALAFEWFKRASNQGDDLAQFSVAVCMFNGEGTKKNETLAVKWLRKAAIQGNPFAQFHLGCCYDYGKGVEKDVFQAVEWYQKAANQDHAEAQFCLGCCLDAGEGVDRNATFAVEWFRKAANQGYVAAQFNLAHCYDNGQGVEMNKVLALEWFQKAADKGCAEARAFLAKTSVSREISLISVSADVKDKSAIEAVAGARLNAEERSKPTKLVVRVSNYSLRLENGSAAPPNTRNLSYFSQGELEDEMESRSIRKKIQTRIEESEKYQRFVEDRVRQKDGKMDQSSHGTSKPKISITDGSLMLATLFKYSKPKPSEDEFKSITETIEKLQGLKVIKGNAVTKSVLQNVKKAFSDTIIANSRYPMSKETMQEIVGDPMFGVTNVKDDDGVFEMICDLYKMYVEDQNDEIEDHSKSNKRGRTEFDEDE